MSNTTYEMCLADAPNAQGAPQAVDLVAGVFLVGIVEKVAPPPVLERLHLGLARTFHRADREAQESFGRVVSALGLAPESPISRPEGRSSRPPAAGPTRARPMSPQLAENLRKEIHKIARHTQKSEDAEDTTQQVLVDVTTWYRNEQARRLPTDTDTLQVARTSVRNFLHRHGKAFLIRGEPLDRQPFPLTYSADETLRLVRLDFQIACTNNHAVRGGTVVFPAQGKGTSRWDGAKWHAVDLSRDRAGANRYRAQWAPLGDTETGTYVIRWRATYDPGPQRTPYERRFDVVTSDGRPRDPTELSTDAPTPPTEDQFERGALLPLFRAIADLKPDVAKAVLGELLEIPVPVLARWLGVRDRRVHDLRFIAHEKLRDTLLAGGSHADCRRQETFIALDPHLRGLALDALGAERPHPPDGPPSPTGSGTPGGAEAAPPLTAQTPGSLFKLLIEVALARGIALAAYIHDASVAGILPADAATPVRQEMLKGSRPLGKVLVRIVAGLRKVWVDVERQFDAAPVAFVGATSFSAERPSTAPDAPSSGGSEGPESALIVLSTPGVRGDDLGLRVRRSRSSSSAVEVVLATVPHSLLLVSVWSTSGEVVAEIDVAGTRRGEVLMDRIQIEPGSYILEAHRHGAGRTAWRFDVLEDGLIDNEG